MLPNYEYHDWVKEVKRAGGPFTWVRQNRNFPQCAMNGLKPTSRTPREIVEEVLKSARVKAAVKEYARENGSTKQEAYVICRKIIGDMAHNFNLTSVRMLGYVLTKVLTTVFEEVLVNNDELKKLKDVFKDTPVVFVPTHRTYVDFMLLSILCFDQEMCLPAIAAAMDFMNSPLIGEALRQCGAFFIKRAVGQDLLYWSIFTEYVQTHIVKGDRPVEFFIEGTRSRVGKSIPPKYGLLQTLLEPYLRGRVYDIVVVPVAMNYDKLLEEQLYGYELLGFPKPKESTSGLLKARSILDKSFGRATITFCPPFSIREHLGVSIRRSAFVCQPDSQWKMEEKERKMIRRFGHTIVGSHHTHSTVTVWPIVCSAILSLNTRSTSSSSRTFSVSEVMSETLHLIELLKNIGIIVTIRMSLQEDIRHFFNLHSDLFTTCDFSNFGASFSMVDLPVDQGKSTVSKQILERAVVPIVISNYANEAMHLLSGPSFLSTVLLSWGQNPDVLELEKKYLWLREFLYREFVYDKSIEELPKLLNAFEYAQIIRIENGQVHMLNEDSLRRLSLLTKNALYSFSSVIYTLIALHPVQVFQDEALKAAQRYLADLSSISTTVSIACLCMEPLKSVFATLEDKGFLEKKAKNYEIRVNELRDLGDRLKSLIVNWKNEERANL